MYRLERQHYIAADLFGYSYVNYAAQLSSGHERYNLDLPHIVQIFDTAARDNWPQERLQQTLLEQFDLRLNQQELEIWLDKFQAAENIFEATTPAQAYRLAVRQDLAEALTRGLHTVEELDDLVQRIMNRTADLAYLLHANDSRLLDCAEELCGYSPFDDTLETPELYVFDEDYDEDLFIASLRGDL